MQKFDRTRTATSAAGFHPYSHDASSIDAQYQAAVEQPVSLRRIFGAMMNSPSVRTGK
jgi:hypothetical protein